MDIQSQIDDRQKAKRFLNDPHLDIRSLAHKLVNDADTMQLMLAVCEIANRLQNEVHGSLQYIDREVAGNTNYVCLQTAAIATREALTALEKSCTT